MELVTWRGTPGVGDFMWALNCAHNYCYHYNKKVVLEFHWEHGENHLHHFEDPETIIERLEYLHNFYHRKDDVKVVHVYESDSRYKDWSFSDDLVHEKDGSVRIAAKQRKNKSRFWFQSGTYSDQDGSPIPDSNWIFREDAFREIDKRKIVIWRPTFNAEIPRTWKRQLTNETWDDIIRQLSASGLYVVELTYRTPVSEALYHISTCRQIVCYDGMWHYIARNLCRPMVIVSTEGVTKYHTPHCIRANPDLNEEINIMWWIDNVSEMLGHSKRKAVDYETKCRKFYE
jgi:hypothetical protein